MKIAVASGKGGTGKTTVATNLTYILAESGIRTIYIDCDVEEPNGSLFLKPEWSDTREVSVKIPKVDNDKCTYCGDCARICQYNAIAVLLDKVMVFPQLCHSCGGCFHICPEHAVTEIDRPIGVINIGANAGMMVYEGCLNIGEAISPPLIKSLKETADQPGVQIIDAPPGTSCPVIETVRGSDYVILVTEPTPFGLNDLRLAVGMVRELGLPFGLVINRHDIGDNRVIDYCHEQNIEILMEIPEDRDIAASCSAGNLIAKALPEHKKYFERLAEKVVDLAKSSKTGKETLCQKK